MSLSCAFRIILTIALITSTLGCSKSPEKAIETVLNDCAKFSQKINRSDLSAAEAAYAVSSKMQSMDTRDCPPEFRAAFQEHINAWRMGAEYFAADIPLVHFMEGLYSGYTGDFSGFGGTANRAYQASQYINATYYQLVQIASYYGARVPESSINR